LCHHTTATCFVGPYSNEAPRPSRTAISRRAEPEGNAAASGVKDQLVQNIFNIPRAHGEGVDAAAIELGKEDQEAVFKSSLLPSPDPEVRKGILAAPLLAAGNILQISLQIRVGQSLKIDHIRHILLQNSIPHFAGFSTVCFLFFCGK
jgi:hypothetical protein